MSIVEPIVEPKVKKSTWSATGAAVAGVGLAAAGGLAWANKQKTKKRETSAALSHGLQRTQRDSCAERKQWFEVLSQLQINAAGILCDPVTTDALLFEPELEQSLLLQQWLEYRGVPFAALSPTELASASSLDMMHRGNVPPMAGFRFDPGLATVPFLEMWLSWYGVTATEEQKPDWWIERVAFIQQQLPVLKKEDLIQQFFYLQKAVNSQSYKGLIESVGRLTPMEIEHLKQSPSPPARVRSWDIKRILAFALDASAVAVPFLIRRNKTYLQSLPLSPPVIQSLKAVGVVLSGDVSTARWLLSPEKAEPTVLQEIGNVGQVVAIKMAQGVIDKKVKGDPHLLIGQKLIRDVTAILIGQGETIPSSSVLKQIAKHYLRDHPLLLLGINDIVIPVYNKVYRSKK